MGYIVVLTNLNCIHVFNLMGDHIICFSGNTLKAINRKMQKLKKGISEQHYDKNRVESTLSPDIPQINQRKRSGDNI